MMNKLFVNGLLLAALLLSCHKQGTNGADVTLTASSANVSVGQTVTVSANTRANSLRWTVTPSGSAAKAYDVTTEKINYLTFSQPGSYIVGVRARNVELDSVHHCNYADSTGGHHIQDSLWNHHIDSLWVIKGFHRGDCKKGIDSASLRITVN